MEPQVMETQAMDPQLIRIIISAVIILLVYPIVRLATNKLVNNVAKYKTYDISRTQAIKKTLKVITKLVFITILVGVWGVNTKNLLVAMSSVFAVIGVAFFAQWSILSNITSGIVLYFSLQLKVGDKIRILDKDFPLEVTISDIRTFYVYMETSEGEQIVYPNSLILQKAITVLQKDK